MRSKLISLGILILFAAGLLFAQTTYVNSSQALCSGSTTSFNCKLVVDGTTEVVDMYVSFLNWQIVSRPEVRRMLAAQTAPGRLPRPADDPSLPPDPGLPGGLWLVQKGELPEDLWLTALVEIAEAAQPGTIEVEIADDGQDA